MGGSRTNSWGRSPAIERQLEVLEGHGIELPANVTREQAGILIYKHTVPKRRSGATRRGEF